MNTHPKAIDLTCEAHEERMPQQLRHPPLGALLGQHQAVAPGALNKTAQHMAREAPRGLRAGLRGRVSLRIGRLLAQLVDMHILLAKHTSPLT